LSRHTLAKRHVHCFLGVNYYKQQFAFTRDFAVDASDSCAFAGSCRHSTNCRRQFQRVTRYNLSPKPCAIQASKKRKLANKLWVAHDCQRARLSNRLTNQHARQCWSTRKVSFEKCFISRELPNCRCRNAWCQFGDRIHK